MHSLTLLSSLRRGQPYAIIVATITSPCRLHRHHLAVNTTPHIAHCRNSPRRWLLCGTIGLSPPPLVPLGSAPRHIRRVFTCGATRQACCRVADGHLEAVTAPPARRDASSGRSVNTLHAPRSLAGEVKGGYAVTPPLPSINPSLHLLPPSTSFQPHYPFHLAMLGYPHGVQPRPDTSC